MGGGVSAGPGVGSSPAGVSGGAEGFSSTPMDGEGVAETGEAVCVGVRLDPAPWSSSPQAAATTAPATTNRMVNPRRTGMIADSLADTKQKAGLARSSVRRKASHASRLISLKCLLGKLDVFGSLRAPTLTGPSAALGERKPPTLVRRLRTIGFEEASASTASRAECVSPNSA